MTQQIGKYQILEKIGQGGFGDVYLAEDTMLGSPVALKVLAPVYMRDPTVVRRFQQEARAAARLRHPNIVRIYDLNEGDGMLYLAMDYLPGHTLAEVIREGGPLPLTQVADLLTQVASALDYAHGRGLTHRDVKPGNVMVSEDGHATLMDFGLVKAADHTQFTVLYRTADSEQFTTGGGTIGTPEYMAPEQADPSLGEVGPLTDLYALGIMAYQMVTGRVPFQASTPIATLRAHADLAPPPPSQWVEVPEEVAGVVLRALAKQPEERWPGAGAFAEALTAAVAQSQAAATQESELAALYPRVEEALAGQQWALALGLCGQIMARAPAYRQVADLFDRANQGLARQRDWETQQEELAALYDEAVQYMADANWDEAILLLAQIQDQSRPYTFRDVPQRLAEAREAQVQAEAKRVARLEETQQEVLALAEQLNQTLSKWTGLCPGAHDVQAVKNAVDSLLDHWRDTAPREFETVAPAEDEEALSPPEVLDGEPEAAVTLDLEGVRESLRALGAQLRDAVAEGDNDVPKWFKIWGAGMKTLITEVEASTVLEDEYILERLKDSAEELETAGEELVAMGEELEVMSEELEAAAALEDEELLEWLRDPDAELAPRPSRRIPPMWQQIGIEMVTIPAGEFLYGEKKERIYLPEYAMAKTPVTNAQYKAFVDATGHKHPRYWRTGKIPKGKENHPVVYVDWDDAAAFCGWAGCRLPTEQEWEKGARGTDGREYPWGDGWQMDRCNTKESGIDDTTPVDRNPNGASPYGLLDMAGNVWEWCEYWYGAHHNKVLRGGSWDSYRDYVRSTYRSLYYPVQRLNCYGFRCVVLSTSP